MHIQIDVALHCFDMQPVRLRSASAHVNLQIGTPVFLLGFTSMLLGRMGVLYGPTKQYSNVLSMRMWMKTHANYAHMNCFSRNLFASPLAHCEDHLVSSPGLRATALVC